MTQQIISTGFLYFDKTTQLMKIGQCLLKARSFDPVLMLPFEGWRKKEEEKFLLTVKLLREISSLAAVNQQF